MRNLKDTVNLWQRNKNKQMYTKLLLIEDKISELFENCLSHVFSQEELDLLRTLKHKKYQILDDEEATGRLRIRATWMEKGDKNT